MPISCRCVQTRQLSSTQAFRYGAQGALRRPGPPHLAWPASTDAPTAQTHCARRRSCMVATALPCHSPPSFHFKLASPAPPKPHVDLTCGIQSAPVTSFSRAFVKSSVQHLVFRIPERIALLYLPHLLQLVSPITALRNFSNRNCILSSLAANLLVAACRIGRRDEPAHFSFLRRYTAGPHSSPRPLPFQPVDKLTSICETSSNAKEGPIFLSHCHFRTRSSCANQVKPGGCHTPGPTLSPSAAIHELTVPRHLLPNTARTKSSTISPLLPPTRSVDRLRR